MLLIVKAVARSQSNNYLIFIRSSTIKKKLFFLYMERINDFNVEKQKNPFP